MRIGIDGRALKEKKDGISTYVYETIKEMNNNDKINDYYIYSNKKVFIDFSLNDNFHIKEYHSKIGTLWLYFLLPKILKEDKIDVFWGPEHCLPRRNKNTKGIKFILTVHDLAIHKFKNIGSNYNTIIQKIFLKRSCKAANTIVADSKATKEDIVKILKIKKEKIKVVYLGTSSENEYNISIKEEREILKKFNVENKNYLLFVSTIEPRKNVIRIIEAFELIKEENKTLKLILAGKLGWKYKQIIKKIESSKYKEDINLAGFISKEEKECLFHNTNCFVYPSLYEGFGLPILEAMKRGVVIVTSNVSSMPEVGGDLPFYLNNVYSSKELAGLLNNALKLDIKEREKIIERGYIRVKKFTWKKCADNILKILTD